jgi:hypothetical protein
MRLGWELLSSQNSVTYYSNWDIFESERDDMNNDAEGVTVSPGLHNHLNYKILKPHICTV